MKIELPKWEEIEPGDKVRYRSYGRDRELIYTAKKNEDGGITIRHRSRYDGKTWTESVYEPTDEGMEKLHRKWEKVTRSPAIEFLWRFDKNANFKSSNTELGIRESALYLAVDAGMEFWRDDFEIISPDYTSRVNRLPLGRISFNSERLYSHILKSGENRKADMNKSALIALEKHMNRKPFLLNGRRLYVDCGFRWDGEHVRCTSIKKDYKTGEETLIACKQRYEDNTWKTERIYRITHEDLES